MKMIYFPMPMQSPARLPKLSLRRPGGCRGARPFHYGRQRWHTPWQMLRALAGEVVPWEGVHVVAGGRARSAGGDPDRNLTHLRESLLEHAPLRPEQIHAMRWSHPT